MVLIKNFHDGLVKKIAKTVTQFWTKLSRFPFLEKSLHDLIVTGITPINIAFGTLVFGK